MSQHQGGAPHFRSSTDDNLLVFALIVFSLGAGLYAAWHFFHPQISAAVMAVQHWQMQLAAVFTDRYQTLDAQVVTRDPAGVKIVPLWHLMHNVGVFFRIPAVVLLLVLALWCLLRNAPSRFTRDLDLPGLMRTQAETFPAAAPFVRRKLGLVPPADGVPRPGDPALHAREWVARFACAPDGTYSEHRAAAELTQQLGPVWESVAQAAPQVRCLFAACVLHAARRRQDAIELLGALAMSLPDGRHEGPSGPDAPLAFSPKVVATADAILSDGALTASCVEIASQHAFTATAMMSVLSHARVQAGVLAPAQFAFLKLVDRRLWYALHSLGFPGGQNRAEQPNPRIEAAGARNHWAAERDAGRLLLEPSLDRALALTRNEAGKAGIITTSQTETAA